MWRTALSTVCYVQFGIMEIFNCNIYVMCQCQIRIICYDFRLYIGFRVKGLGIGLGLIVRVPSLCTALAHKWAVYIISLPNAESCEYKGACAALSDVNNEKFRSHWLQQLQYSLLHWVLFNNKKYKYYLIITLKWQSSQSRTTKNLLTQFSKLRPVV